MSKLLKYIIICISLAIIPSSSLFSQEKYLLAYEQEGDNAMEDGEYEIALDYYKTARKFFTPPLRLYYKCAEACRYLKDYDKAEYYYQKVITENDTTNLFKEFPNLHLNLVEVSISNGNIFAAQDILNKLLVDCPSIDIRKKAKRKLQSIDWLINNNKLEFGVSVKNIGRNVNDESSQECHYISGDSLLFLSNIEYKKGTNKGVTFYQDTYQQIYISHIDSDFYSPSERFDVKEINKKKKNISNICFDPNTKTAYFTRCNSYNNDLCYIYYSTFKEGKYSKAKKLSKKVNLKGFNNTHPNIGIENNQTILYFSSNRSGSYGGYDLYYYILDGKDSEPVNLGQTINTEGNEITPYYCSKDKSLYFSSDYHFGFGGYDIFSSEGWQTRWTTPKNLMQPINSPANEIYPVIVDPYEKGYFTSNREGSYSSKNKTCCYDIYNFKIDDIPHTPTMDLIVKKVPFSPIFDLPLQLFFHNDQPKAQTNSGKTNIDYEQCYKEYKSLNNIYKAECTKSINDSTESAILDSVDNFFSVHLDKEMNKLNDMLKYLLSKMENGEKIDISIRGYASALYNETYNYALSERRIETIINYMEKWNDGALKHYLNTLANDSLPFLNIKTMAMGKIESKSENPKNIEERRKSIYTLDAMYERRIEIRLIEIRK